MPEKWLQISCYGQGRRGGGTRLPPGPTIASRREENLGGTPIENVFLGRTTMNYGNTLTNEGTIDALNELLRGELSAVESYDKALPAVEGEARVRADLLECRSSHEARAQRIREAIMQAGGEPARASGAWGLFARTLAGGARALGWKTVVSTLEEGEDH